ncbi:MAG: pantetheine-phosphate adenylyltransferase [Phycisphaerales bacterium]|nr:pantetheine-phosphate adenylyltransferase [Phycisphaerales bacterium]
MPTRRIVAVYPGSFDPVTHGHLDVIRRASNLFNELVVGVGDNPDKAEMFTSDERVEMVEAHCKDLQNVRVQAYDGLTIDFVRGVGARVIVRGIRDVADLSGELRQANVNLAIGSVETVFLLTSDQHVLTSSTYDKQIYELGGGDPERLRRLVPDNVARKLAAKLGKPAKGRRKK